jgi:aryl-alcohol dehydrogenase-like predicted oxidoreductase
MIELEVIPACRELGLGLIPWSPLAAGILGGILPDQNMGRRITENAQKNLTKFRPQIEAYEKLCDDAGEKPADIALAWLLHNPVVTSPIIGPRTMEQLTGTLRTLDLQLTAEMLQKLDEIWPGPGGEAPEAYSW